MVELALKHAAGVATETSVAAEAYAPFPEAVNGSCRNMVLATSADWLAERE